MCRPQLNFGIPWLVKSQLKFKEPKNLVLLGCSGSGKTTFLRALKGERGTECAPSLGVVVERIRHKSTEWQVVDIGGDGTSGRTLSQLEQSLDKDSVAVFFHECSQGNTNATIKCFEQHITAMLDCKARFLWVVLYTRATITNLDEYLSIELVKKWFTARLNKLEGQIVCNLWHQRRFNFALDWGVDKLMNDITTTCERNANFEPRPAVTIIDRWQQQSSDITATSEGDQVTTVYSNQLRQLFSTAIRGLESSDGLMDIANEYFHKSTGTPEECDCRNMSIIIFRLYHIKLAIEKYKQKTNTRASEEDFDQVLACAGSTLAENFWRKYYSQYLMYDTPSHYRLPDLCDLPCLGTPSAAAPHCTSCDQCTATEHPERLPRFAFGAVKTYLMSKYDRNMIVELALSTLHSVTIRQRKRESTIELYSETQTYFWIQYMHQLVTRLVTHKLELETSAQMTKEEYATVLSDMDYVHFKQLVAINPTVWKHHYTPKLWSSLAARQSHQVPDKQPLRHDSVQTIDIHTIADDLHKQLWKDGHVQDIPSEEELSFKAALAFHIMEVHPREQKDSHLQLLHDIFAYLVAHMGNKASWNVPAISALLITRDRQDKSEDKIIFWIRKMVDIVGSDDWSTPRSEIGNAIGVFEQFRIVVNTNLWLMHESLYDVERSREERRAELLQLGKVADHASCVITRVSSEEIVIQKAVDGSSDALAQSKATEIVSACETACCEETADLDAKSDWEVVD